MKSAFTAFFTGLLLASCMTTDKSVTPDDPDWIRLEAPTGGEAMDVAGNLDSTLFVATNYKVYKTTNQGRSWEVIRSSHYGPVGLYAKRDTLFILMQRYGNKKVAERYPDYTVDGGKTWRRYPNATEFSRPINQVQAPDGTTYTVKENSTPMSASSNSAYVNPSDIRKDVVSVQGQIRFPFKHTITSLLLDSQNRLYVAVSGTHVPETNRIYCCPEELPSVVYISRRPLP